MEAFEVNSAKYTVNQLTQFPLDSDNQWNGPSLTSNGTKHIFSPPYSPQSNGQTEISVGFAK